MAAMTSLVALSIDAVLPALPDIASHLGVLQSNQRQLVITYLFLGLAVGTLVYGPVSDSFGRKRPVYFGFALFAAGTLISLFANSFSMMLFGRVLQGIGIAGPRIVSNAIVRDMYRGRDMARVMSLVMVVFILVPALAPIIGQAVMKLGGWQAIFVLFLILTIIVVIWFGVRQPETLDSEHRKPLSFFNIVANAAIVLRNPVAMGYTISSGLILGAFIGYLNSAQQILQELYNLGDRFPLYFASIALFIGFSSYINSRLVIRFGMRYLSGLAIGAICLMSVTYILYTVTYDGVPPLETLLLYLGLTFFCVGILFGNFNALALEPKEFGRIAGVAAAVVGSLSTLIAVPLGGMIGHLYNETVFPLLIGFTLLGVSTVIVMTMAEKYRQPD